MAPISARDLSTASKSRTYGTLSRWGQGPQTQRVGGDGVGVVLNVPKDGHAQGVGLLGVRCRPTFGASMSARVEIMPWSPLGTRPLSHCRARSTS